MPLPAGFKVNGSEVGSSSGCPISPGVRKAMTFLDRQPVGEVFTSVEFFSQLGMAINSGGISQHPALRDYHEKVDNKMFWGSRESIAKLREQLAEPEESHGENI